MAIFFSLQSGRCREVQLYILNNELLLGAKKERKKETRLKYINYFLFLTLVITVKVHLLRDFTTETKR